MSDLVGGSYSPQPAGSLTPTELTHRVRAVEPDANRHDDAAKDKNGSGGQRKRFQMAESTGDSVQISDEARQTADLESAGAEHGTPLQIPESGEPDQLRPPAFNALV